MPVPPHREAELAYPNQRCFCSDFLGSPRDEVAGGHRGTAPRAVAQLQQLLPLAAEASVEHTPVAGSTSSTFRAAAASPASQADTDRTCS
jgi:hypothetical protein